MRIEPGILRQCGRLRGGLRGACGLCFIATTCMTCVRYEGQKDPLVGAPNDDVGAGVLAATGVGAAVVHRELTGGCVAQCRDGWTCNRETGLCEQSECRCPSGQRCVRDGELVRCLAETEDDDAVVGPVEDITCRKKADCGPDEQCCFSPAPVNTTACLDECAEIIMVACDADDDCEQGMRCIDVGHVVNVCAP